MVATTRPSDYKCSTPDWVLDTKVNKCMPAGATYCGNSEFCADGQVCCNGGTPSPDTPNADLTICCKKGDICSKVIYPSGDKAARCCGTGYKANPVEIGQGCVPEAAVMCEDGKSFCVG